MANTYRAAYWTDGRSNVRLTTEGQQHLSDDELMAAAQEEAQNTDLEIGDGRIEIGDYTE